MKKADSKWAYHYDKKEFKEFPSGTLDKGYKNIFLSCLLKETIASEESVIAAQLAERFLEEFVENLKIRGIVERNKKLYGNFCVQRPSSARSLNSILKE